MTSPALYSFSDVVQVWRDARKHSAPGTDLAGAYGTRYAAFASAFGADLEHEPKVAPPMPAWIVDLVLEFRGSDDVEWEAGRWHTGIHRLALSIEVQLRGLHGPFAGYMEAPLPVIAAHRRYAESINERVEDLRHELDEMLVDLLAELYPVAAKQQVHAEELAAHGYDDLADVPDSDGWG
ncbi:unannotated protein [freshwater metagenome]|uniref:Unannotated protein n=1 Tax=freshwater metagenome TaxID=449393 RepID=A0A6J7JYP5_9ZZZZ|nr:hypothetical protein [Actinomycetota bacterium]